MDTTLLRPFLPSSFAGDLDGLWATYAAGTTDPNPHGFVTWLFHQGHIEGRDARAVLTSGRTVVTLSHHTDTPVFKGQVPPHEALGVIGRGAMGEVLVVRDRALRRTVALKRALAGAASDEHERELFLNEAQITAQLNHPGIVPVYGFEGDSEGGLAYTMKLVHGRTLQTFLDDAREQVAATGTTDDDHGLARRLELFLAVCAPLAYAHQHGVVHRDLKPENIMVAAFDEVLVMDWGIARTIPADRPDGPLRVVGTPAYMSPEQAFGAPMALEPASDQYALGLILAELVGLAIANPGSTPLECIERAREGAVSPIVPVAGEGAVVRELQAIVDRATQRKPARRYPSVAALADDVRRYLRDDEVSVAPDKGVQKLQRWVSRHRERAVAIGFGLVLLLVLGAVGMSALNEARIAQEKRVAAERQEKLRQLASISARQVSSIDAEFHGWEALVTGIAFTAETSLTRPAAPDPPYNGVTPGAKPADLEPSPYYGVGVSLETIDFSIAPGAERVEEQLPQLKRISSALRTAFIQGASTDAGRDEAAVRARIRDPGVRIVYAYVATDAGVMGSFPGTNAGYSAAYDHRTRGWYRVAMGRRGPIWNALMADESGMGLLLTVSRGLYDEAGAFLGVAAMDVGFGYLIEELLDAPELAGTAEAFLVDAEGLVVARSSHKATAKSAREFVPTPFEHADLLPTVKDDGGGWVELDGAAPMLMHWHALDAVDWTYVIVGDRAALMTLGRGAAP